MGHKRERTSVFLKWPPEREKHVPYRDYTWSGSHKVWVARYPWIWVWKWGPNQFLGILSISAYIYIYIYIYTYIYADELSAGRKPRSNKSKKNEWEMRTMRLFITRQWDDDDDQVFILHAATNPCKTNGVSLSIKRMTLISASLLFLLFLLALPLFFWTLVACKGLLVVREPVVHTCMCVS